MITDAVRAKIEKLLALASRGGTTAEAALAQSKLNDLLTKLGASLDEARLQEKVISTPELPPGARGAYESLLNRVAVHFHGLVARVSADKFKVYSIGPYCEVIEYTIEQAVNKVKAAARDQGIWRIHKRAQFFAGAFDSINVAPTKDELDEFWDLAEKLGLEFTTRRERVTQGEAYELGQQAGKDIRLNSGVGSMEGKYLS